MSRQTVETSGRFAEVSGDFQGFSPRNLKYVRAVAAARLNRQIVQSSLGEIRLAELKHGLLAHIQDCLLEVGKGFAFVGLLVQLDIDVDDFYLDY